ncbi:hypothetical protein SISSUDRAFT_1121617 [Sistotremastrum suecicum HHB10207 ss-3]|uniref:Uncharacterized protein n=1 Tax=Sistotremastrum suecicum HHB10207 ss-3 TaxID=1314776 RepID=A0A166AK23_9AGAM|nr:hypothetical protein SISSUDRAFT_1121617 [Sistotremastrum suecicum HHB10207 ss-3]
MHLQIPPGIPEMSFHGYVRKGLECGNVQKHSHLTPEFRAALLNWDLLPHDDDHRKSLLREINLSDLLLAYVLGSYWSHHEIGPGDHRTRYRVILNKLRPELKHLIGGYKETASLARSLLSKFKHFATTLPHPVEMKDKVAKFVAGNAFFGILEHMRPRFEENPAATLVPCDFTDLEPLTTFFRFPMTTSTSTIYAQASDWKSLPSLNTFIFYVDRCLPSGTESSREKMAQFLVNCLAFLGSQPQPITPLLQNTITLLDKTSIKIKDVLGSTWPIPNRDQDESEPTSPHTVLFMDHIKGSVIGSVSSITQLMGGSTSTLRLPLISAEPLNGTRGPIRPQLPRLPTEPSTKPIPEEPHLEKRETFDASQDNGGGETRDLD